MRRTKGWPRRATPTKCLCVILLLFAACRSQNEPATPQNVATENIISATPPFKTKEPERYSATRTITTVTPEGKTTVTKTLIARDGEMRRNESGKVTYLDLPDGRFILLPDDKVYADLATETNTDDNEEEVSPERLLHDEPANTSYQKIGTELIDGRNTQKYRILVNNSTPESVSQSEALIWIDEALNMPIRSETASADGTKITMELSNVALDVERRVFQIPDDYKKVAFSELRKRLRKTD